MDIAPIKTQRDYRNALKEIEGLMTAKRNTRKGNRLDVLVTLVSPERQAVPIASPLYSTVGTALVSPNGSEGSSNRTFPAGKYASSTGTPTPFIGIIYNQPDDVAAIQRARKFQSAATGMRAARDRP